MLYVVAFVAIAVISAVATVVALTAVLWPFLLAGTALWVIGGLFGRRHGDDRQFASSSQGRPRTGRSGTVTGEVLRPSPPTSQREVPSEQVHLPDYPEQIPWWPNR